MNPWCPSSPKRPAGAPLLAWGVVLAAIAACAPGRDGAAAAIADIDSLPSPAGPGSGEPNLATAADGRVYLTWLEPAADSAHALRVAALDPATGRWSEPAIIAQGKRFFVNWADFPSLEAFPDGRLAAHWLQRSGAGKYAYDVRIAQSVDGGRTWSDAVIPHRDGTETEHGFASLFPVGDSLGAVWLDGRKFATAAAPASGAHAARAEMTLRYTTVARDGGLGAEQVLDERICDCCQTSSAPLPNGGRIVVYRDRSAEEIRDISAVRFLDGAWTPPVRVHADDWHIAACPVNGPAVDARGDRVVVAWFTGARDTARVLVAFSSDGGATFGPPSRVDGGSPAGRVDVTIDSAGGALVSWIERSGGESAEVRVRGVRAPASGRVAMSEPVTVATSSAARASGFPRMVRSDDQVILAWTSPGIAGASPGVRVARARVR